MGEDVSTVTRLQEYQFRLRINEEEAHQMRGFAGSCRFVFNRALALQQEIYALCGFRPGYGELCEEMARWKKEPETSWLKDAPSQALQQSLKNLEDGWHRHFESLKELKAGKINPNQLVGSPRFKKNSDGNWSTRCSGLAACSSRFHRKRPASLVLDVVTSPRRTARRKRSLLVSSAASPKMPT